MTNDQSQWDNRRILTMLALGTLVVSLIWRLPDELRYIGEKAGALQISA